MKGQLKGDDYRMYRNGVQLKLDAETVMFYRKHEMIMRAIREEMKEINVRNIYRDTPLYLTALAKRSCLIRDILRNELKKYEKGTIEYKTVRGAFVAMKNSPKRILDWTEVHPEAFDVVGVTL